MKKNKGPKILVLDIETAPIISHVWALFDQNIALNQIVKDWHVLSWSAKWYKNNSGEVFGPNDKIMYMDQRNVKNVEDDSKILKEIWKLLDEADIVIGQNSKKFDVKKLNARFLMHGFQPPSNFKQLDTLVIAKKYFNFTSNKLEYMTDKLCKKYKKLKHKRFPGHSLWTECLNGNKKAWEEMKRYNIHDVLSTEELYNILQPWDNSISFAIYGDLQDIVCNCGSKRFQSRGTVPTSAGAYRRFQCQDCGTWTKGKLERLTKEQRENIRRKI